MASKAIEKFDPTLDDKDVVERQASDEVVYEGGRHYSQAAIAKVTRTSSILTVLVAGPALFSDGYNAQIIG